MKGPKDEVIDVAMRGAAEVVEAAETAESSEVAKAKPPGGKVLQRLILFNEARGTLEVATAVTTPETKPRKARKSATAEPEMDTASLAAVYAETAMALQATSPGTGFAAEDTEDAVREESLETREVSAAALPAWRFLGPTMMSNGQTYGDSRVVVSGRVSAIAVDPSNANHLLCGGAQGGVWESRDRGASWAPRTDTMPTLTVGAIAFNPSAPATVYCGTGEGNWWSWLGAGVLRSTNGGTTWAVRAGAPFVGQGFYDLIVDPANGNHLLAATTGGIYESSNGGVAWAQRRSARTWDLAMHPAGGAAAEVLAACADGLFRSTNGGTAWTKVTLPGAPASWDRLAVSIARSNPAVAYAFGAKGTTAYLYRRNASGVWQSVAVPGGLSTGQAWYDWFVTASTDTDAQVYLGAIEAYRGTLSGTTWSWVTISNKAGDDIHPDQHALTVDPTNANVIYVGNDGGLFRSPNRGTTWESLNPGLGITEIEYIAQDHGSSKWLLAGTQDNGSIRYTGNPAWDHVADGDGGDCAVNRGTPNTVFHSYYGMGMERSTTKGNFGSFGWIGPNVPSTYRALFYPPMEANGNTIAQAGQSVFISRNNGTAWTEVALPAGVTASAMYIPTPDRVLVGVTDGRIFRITWSGAAWSAAAALTTPRASAWVSDIFVDPTNLNRIWATYTTLGGGRIFRSDNGGTSWLDRSAGLPSLPINSVEVDPGNANRIWAAADLGVYQSFDGGATWATFSAGLPNAFAADLLFHPHARVLRVALRNRGVWEIPVDGWLENPICGVQWTGSLAGNASQRWFTFNWPATWHVLWTVMPITPQPGAPQLTWNVQVERASAEFVTYWITVTNLTPNPATFEGRFAILSRY